MRIGPTILAMTAAGFLAACNQDTACTPEEAQAKLADLNARVTEVGTADPARLAELTPRLQDLAAQASATDGDMTATCSAIDGMMAELAG